MDPIIALHDEALEAVGPWNISDREFAKSKERLPARMERYVNKHRREKPQLYTYKKPPAVNDPSDTQLGDLAESLQLKMIEQQIAKVFDKLETPPTLPPSPLPTFTAAPTTDRQSSPTPTEDPDAMVDPVTSITGLCGDLMAWETLPCEPTAEARLRYTFDRQHRVIYVAIMLALFILVVAIIRFSS